MRATATVMAGLVPAIHVFAAVGEQQDMDARNKCGHDEASMPVMLRQRVRPEVAGPMTSSGGASSIHCGDGEYGIVRLRGR